MFDFLIHADPYLRTFWYIAIFVSLVFIIQMAITFIGLSADTDLDDSSGLEDADGIMEYFTVRNAINFLLGFSWTGVCLFSVIENKVFLTFVAVMVGLAFVSAYFYLLQQVRKLEEDNTFNVYQILGSEAEVYLKIPGQNSGTGKIMVSYKGSLRELNAVTEDGSIPTGEKVLIESIGEDGRIIVSSIKQISQP